MSTGRHFHLLDRRLHVAVAGGFPWQCLDINILQWEIADGKANREHGSQIAQWANVFRFTRCSIEKR